MLWIDLMLFFWDMCVVLCLVVDELSEKKKKEGKGKKGMKKKPLSFASLNSRVVPATLTRFCRAIVSFSLKALPLTY